MVGNSRKRGLQETIEKERSTYNTQDFTLKPITSETELLLFNLPCSETSRK